MCCLLPLCLTGDPTAPAQALRALMLGLVHAGSKSFSFLTARLEK